MDLATLLTAYALRVDPRIMHALIWQQSGGKPWSFSVPPESRRQVYPTMQGAICPDDSRSIRIEVTGLSMDQRSATAAVFASCPNITFAALRVVQLGERCKRRPRLKAEAIDCAITLCHSSWERWDTTFADAVEASVVKVDAPNIDMPKDGHVDSPLRSHPKRRRLVCTPPDNASADVPNRDRSADGLRLLGPATAIPTGSRPPADSLLVRRSSEQRT
jgi:hypothetical protein